MLSPVFLVLEKSKSIGDRVFCKEGYGMVERATRVAVEGSAGHREGQASRKQWPNEEL